MQPVHKHSQSKTSGSTHFWMSEVFSYLSWLCSSSISVLCSVTVFRKCWLVCVWQERQDCHLCGMTPDTHLELYPGNQLFPKTCYLSKLSVPFKNKLWSLSIIRGYKVNSFSHTVTEKGCVCESERGKPKACPFIKNASERYSITLSSHTILCPK